jgi:hypothetical protein
VLSHKAVDAAGVLEVVAAVASVTLRLDPVVGLTMV